jgi:hypothetical protein
VWYALDQASATLTAAVGPRHVGLGPCFVEEHDPIRIELQLLGRPLATRFDDVFPLLFERDTRLFFRVRRNARQARLSVTSETSQPNSSRAAATSSRK